MKLLSAVLVLVLVAHANAVLCSSYSSCNSCTSDQYCDWCIGTSTCGGSLVVPLQCSGTYYDVPSQCDAAATAAGLAIGIIVAIVLSIVACICCCVACCVYASRRQPATVIYQNPPMGQPFVAQQGQPAMYQQPQPYLVKA